MMLPYQSPPVWNLLYLSLPFKDPLVPFSATYGCYFTFLYTIRMLSFSTTDGWYSTFLYPLVVMQ
jgi:hypothetical protein